MPDYSHLLPTLEKIAREAGQIAQNSRTEMTRDLKMDGSIVTNADVLVEKFLREKLGRLLPEAGVWGEELGIGEEGPAGLWLLDPIDGTTNFAYRSPLWGISIGLIQGDDLVLGAVALPDLEELYLCAKGHGVTCNGEVLPLIPPGPISREEPVSFGRTVSRALERAPGKLRNGGAFVIDGAFTAAQRIRGMIGIREKLYDIAPCVLFVQELGGEVRYADGSPLNFGDFKVDRKIEKPWLMFPAESGFLMSWTP